MSFQTEGVGKTTTTLDNDAIQTENESGLPDQSDKTITDILSRWDKHGEEYGFKAETDYFHLPFLIQKHSAYSKLQGFYGFHASFSVRLVWNADPFVQGLYMLAYVPPNVFPCESVLEDDKIISEAVFLSGCPRVIFNINSEVHAELTVPFNSPLNFLRTGEASQETLGYFFVVPLSPARGPTCFNQLDYNLYFRFTNLRTYGAYPADFEVEGSWSRAIAQSEARSKINTIDSIGSSIEGFINSFSDENSSFTDKADWIIGGASKIADLMGWSKPLNSATPSVVQTSHYHDMLSSDGIFNAPKMAMNSDSGISKIDLSCRNIDELNISNALSRPNLLPFESNGVRSKKHNWASSDPHGNELYSITMNPSEMYVTSGSKHINTHLSYIAKMFTFWRGSLKVMFKFASTAFQTGRLRIVYVPEAAVDTSMDMLPYTYAHIVDIRQPSSWEFEIPYVREKPWLTRDQSNGNIFILVETPLKAACSVLQDVDYSIFVSAGKDLEFSVPVLPKHTPDLNSSTRPGRAIAQSNAYTSEQYAMLAGRGHREFEMDPSVPIVMIPNSNAKSSIANKLAIGDPVRSLRSVIKRFYSGSDSFWNKTNHAEIHCQMRPVGLAAGTNFDMLCYVSSLYAFWRGGMRFYAQNMAQASVQLLMKGYENGDMCAMTGHSPSIPALTETSPIVDIGLLEATKVEVPYYFTTRCKSTYAPTVDIQPTLIYTTFDAPRDIRVVRAAADDFDLGYLVGAPCTTPL